MTIGYEEGLTIARKTAIAITGDTSPEQRRFDTDGNLEFYFGTKKGEYRVVLDGNGDVVFLTRIDRSMLSTDQTQGRPYKPSVPW